MCPKRCEWMCFKDWVGALFFRDVFKRRVLRNVLRDVFVGRMLMWMKESSEPAFFLFFFSNCFLAPIRFVSLFFWKIEITFEREKITWFQTAFFFFQLFFGAYSFWMIIYIYIFFFWKIEINWKREDHLISNRFMRCVGLNERSSECNVF